MCLATVQVGSAYETGLSDSSVDVIFCIALLHHLNIERVCKEMRRILARNGKIILQEPIRLSPSYARLRNLLPARGNVSGYEHPLTRAEFAAINELFKADGTRYFRLPFVPLLSPIIGAPHLCNMDRLCLHTFPATTCFATCVVTKLGN
jgi:SAM-dependent methyltransferase